MQVWLRVRVLAIAMVVGVSVARAQPAVPPPVGGEDEEVVLTVRLTPGMARGIARNIARDVIVKRYGLEESRTDEVAEVLARRMMQTFHDLDSEQSRASVEQIFSSALETIIDSRENRNRHRGMPPELAKTFADGVAPMVPAIQDLVRNVGQDLRPMLPLKQQLRLAADLMTVKTGLDSFDQVLQRWSAGDVRPFEDPFNPERFDVKLDEDGKSRELKNARLSRAAGVRKAIENAQSKWRDYLKDSIELYGFDESQVATAESVFREMAVRLEAVGQDELWSQRYYQNRLWTTMLGHFNRRWDVDQPFQFLLMEQYLELVDPFGGLGNEFKDRIDQIPRDDQRRAAQKRIEAALREKGIVSDLGQEVRP